MNLFKKIISRAQPDHPSLATIVQDAVVLDLSVNGPVKNGIIKTRVLLQILPKEGRNFVAECDQDFPEEVLGTLHVGSKVHVSYRSKDQIRIHGFMDNAVSMGKAGTESQK